MKFFVAFRTFISIALFVFCFAGSQARASDLPLYFPAEAPSAISNEIFASAYFPALLEAFAKQVEKLGDASCLQAKHLDSKALQERGRRILVRHGERMIQLVQANIDERRFREAGGVEALKEMQRGKSIPVFAELARLDRIAEVHAAADWIVVNFNRYLILSGYNWKGFTGAETGDPALTKFFDEPNDAFDKLFNQYAPETKVFPDLRDKRQKATVDAFDSSRAAEWTPRTYFEGAEKDVAELCLVKQ